MNPFDLGDSMEVKVIDTCLAVCHCGQSIEPKQEWGYEEIMGIWGAKDKLPKLLFYCPSCRALFRSRDYSICRSTMLVFET